jgi:hypothetical protein
VHSDIRLALPLLAPLPPPPFGTQGYA